MLRTEPLLFGTATLALPSGFGVERLEPNPAGSGEPGPGRAAAPILPAPAPAVSTGPVGFEPAADIPAAAPTGAQFASAALAFGGSAIAFGSGAAGFGGGSASLGTSAAGLAVREEPGGGLRFTLAADVLFDFDKWALRRDAGPVLDRLLDEVRARVRGAVRFKVEGHTDWIGSDAYNDRLSNRRAAAVKSWLVKNGGAPSHQVITLGYGERRPVAPNAKPDGSDDPEGRQKNRRVEIVVQPK